MPCVVVHNYDMEETHMAVDVILQRRDTRKGGRWSVSHVTVPTAEAPTTGDTMIRDGVAWEVLAVRPAVAA